MLNSIWRPKQKFNMEAKVNMAAFFLKVNLERGRAYLRGRGEGGGGGGGAK